MAASLSHCWTTNPEDIDLLMYIMKRTKNVESPVNIEQLVRDFKEKSGNPKSVSYLSHRLRFVRTRIHSSEHIDTKTKVKMLFALSATLYAEFLKELKKNAFVEVDEKTRITHYKAIDGSLELKGDHSQSAKYRTAQLESKRSYRSLIFDYFENNNNVDVVPKNTKEAEMWSLIEFITGICENVRSPQSICLLAKDFNAYFGQSLDNFNGRIKSYCYEIQKTEYLDTHSKVKQLFVLSATLESDCLEELRKDAVVEVDHLNRITKYTAKDGSLTLHGDHSQNAKNELAWIEWEKKRRAAKKPCNFGDDDDNNETPIRYLSSSSKWTESFSNNSIRPNELDDYDKNYSIDKQVKLESFHGSIQDNLNEFEEYEVIQQIPKPPQAYGEHNQLIEVHKVKINFKEPVVEIKPETSQNSKTSNKSHWTTDPKYLDLLNYIIERAENVESPVNIKPLVRDFKDRRGAPETKSCLKTRIERLRPIIHSFEHIDTRAKVKMLFALSASVDADFLKKLKKDGLVEVDEKQRIIHYKANDGSLELRGKHSLSAKIKTALLESGGCLRSMINSYFENINDADAVPKNNEEKEMWNLIEFITEKCETINSPLNIIQSVKDFIAHFGISRPLSNIKYRIRLYCREIQRMELLDTLTKVKQLFCLSATLDSNFLKELRKDAVVGVDSLNRITSWIEWKKKRNAAKNYCNSGGDYEDKREKEIDHSEDDSDEYSSEEVDSDNDNHRMDESEDLVKPLKTTYDSEKKKVDGGTRKNNKNPKRKNMCSTASVSERKRNKTTTGCSSSNWTGPFSNNSMRSYELDDYDINYSIEDEVKLEPFRGPIQEDFKEINSDEDIQQIPKPLQDLDEHYQIEEVPIKMESEEQKTVGNPTEDVRPEIAQAHDKHKELIEVPIKLEHEEPVEVKPVISHNPKIKFIEAMQSLIVCLDTPSLSWIQSKIYQKIQKLEERDEVILNKEIALTIDLLISQMTNHSVVNLFEDVESVNLSNFLCYLKASILNSKLIGVEDLVKNISELIEESQNKRIPFENVANALSVALNIDSF
ncbi:unnamed protein product [Caenorhabditis brenneri]